MSSARDRRAPLLLFRAMAPARGGAPQVGPSARKLGVRPWIDIPVTAGAVSPGTGGMSVSPRTPLNLPVFRRPASFGGTGKDPVYCIGRDQLGSQLDYRPDPDDPERHGFIEPRTPMTLARYQAALGTLRSRFRSAQP